MNIINLDLLIQNGQVVTPQGVSRLEVGVQDGKIVLLEPSIETPANQTIDANGRLVFPGFIDAHTHMGIPIMNTHSIDDFESGSIAAACGGVTTIIDFTVQEKGQSLRESVDVRLQKAEGKCHVDFGLHVNITDQPESRIDEIPKLIKEGFTAFKVFSTYRQAGMMVTWDQFRQILLNVNEYGGLLCLHAEDNDVIETLTNDFVKLGATGPSFHAMSRPPDSEASAIRTATEIAEELEASLYIVHLSSYDGLEAALEARARGARVILETCPQYLVLTGEIFSEKNGHYMITTPPLRSEDDSEALWQALAEGHIDVVATDHCPFTAAQKDSGHLKFHLTPNGLPGVETLFPLLYTLGVADNRISVEQLVNVLAEKPAEIFGLYPKKGTIQIGSDADLVIWDPNGEFEITAEKMHGNADWSPYEGIKIRGRLNYTILRGQILVENGHFIGQDICGELQLSKPVH